MASDMIPANKRGHTIVCHYIQRRGVLQREVWDALTVYHPLHASLPFTNLKSTLKTLGESALYASYSPHRLSTPFLPLLPPAATLHNI